MICWSFTNLETDTVSVCIAFSLKHLCGIQFFLIFLGTAKSIYNFCCQLPFLNFFIIKYVNFVCMLSSLYFHCYSKCLCPRMSELRLLSYSYLKMRMSRDQVLFIEQEPSYFTPSTKELKFCLFFFKVGQDIQFIPSDS